MSITLPVSPALLERLVCALERLVPSDVPARPDLLDSAAVAEVLGVSPRQVQRMVQAGKLRKVAGLGAKTTRFRRGDVEKLIAAPEALALGRRRL